MTHIFTTTAGIEIPIQPISLLDLQLAQDAIEKEFLDNNEPIEPPTYEVETFGGGEEINTYTELTIVDAPEEDKEKWRLHLEALDRMGEEIQKRTGIIYLDGITYDLPEDDSWIARRKKLLNEDIPDDPDELKLHYVNNVLLKTPADKSGLMLEIQKLSMTGVNEEAIQAMEELFRSQVEIQGREGTQALKALIQKQEAESMVLQPPDEGRNGSQVKGDDNQAIPESV